MVNTTIYHNPRCSKSRQTLDLLAEQGVQPEVVKYLETPPSVAALDAICSGLDVEPLQIMRTQEARFAELGLHTTDHRSRAEWLQLLHDNPILLERPIVVRGQRYALGRPPESVLALLQD